MIGPIKVEFLGSFWRKNIVTNNLRSWGEATNFGFYKMMTDEYNKKKK